MCKFSDKMCKYSAQTLLLMYKPQNISLQTEPSIIVPAAPEYSLLWEDAVSVVLDGLKVLESTIVLYIVQDKI